MSANSEQDKTTEQEKARQGKKDRYANQLPWAGVVAVLQAFSSR